MPGVFADALIAILAAMLIVAATGDLRTRTIPNWLNGAIALGAIPFWIVSGLSVWPDMAIQIGVALAVFALFALAFHLGAMGGGDVKMVAALALWLPLGAVIKLIVIMSIAGGVLTVLMLVRHRLAKSGKQLEIPYGVAIAFGGFWLIAERFLNQFG
ncbi:MAG: prepilin peptidase [Pseudomonadota bacterium]|nr:prepilin peptidase [Pseudomonadota bacterium]